MTTTTAIIPVSTAVTVAPVQVVQVEKSEVLSSTTRTGDFVHQNQKMATEQDFRNISKLWYDKTISYEQGREQMARERSEREDIVIDTEAVEFSADDNGIIVTLDGRQFRPTKYAVDKICSWFHTPSTIATFYLNPPNNASYKRDVDDYDVLCYALENGRRRIKPARGEDKKELLFRTYKDGTLRSVMSTDYSIIDNDWVLDLLSKLIPGGRLSHWRGDADTIYGNIIIPDSIRAEVDSEYGGMLSLSNCEIGKRVYGQTPSIFRAICMNGNIWGQTKGIELRQRHKGVNLEDLAEATKANIMKQIPLMTEKVDVLLATRQWQLEANAANAFAAIAQMAKLTPQTAESIAVEWMNQGQEKTAFGFIDAVTRTSQTQDNETYVLMDMFAGNMLSRKVWENINHIGRGLDDKQVKKMLNQAV